MRVTLVSNIIGVGNAGDTVDDPRAEDWIARGLAVAEGSVVAPSVVAATVVAPVVATAPPSSAVPDFFAPEPPATEEPKRKKR